MSATASLERQIDHWIAMNDPERPRPLAAASPRLAAAATALSEAIGAATAVVSHAVLVGSDVEPGLHASRSLKKLITDRKADEALARFKAQPMDGCTSVMNLARTAARFNPLTPDVQGNIDRFRDYTQRILDAPFFNLGYADSKKETRKSQNWSVLISSIVNLFEGVADKDRDRITKGLTSLAEAATSRSGTRQQQNLFVQNVLQADGGTLSVFIYYSTVALQEDKSKGSTSRQTEFTIARSQLVFRTGDWPYFAERVWKRQVSVVDDWLDGNTTKPGAEPIALCITG